MKYAQAGTVVRNELPVNVRTEPFVMPEAGDDEQILYVNSVKSESPIDYFTVGGLNFQKLLIPRASGYLENDGKYFAPLTLVRKLTKKQAEALIKAAHGKKVRIPQRPNRDWNQGDSPEEEFLPPFDTDLGEWIICEPQEEYDRKDREIPTIYNQRVEAPTHATREELNTELMRQQSKKIKK